MSDGFQIFIATYGLVAIVISFLVNGGTKLSVLKSIVIGSALVIHMTFLLLHYLAGMLIDSLFSAALTLGGEDEKSFLMSALQKKMEVEGKYFGGDRSDKDDDLH